LFVHMPPERRFSKAELDRPKRTVFQYIPIVLQ
jgi:hypothetical protein